MINQSVVITGASSGIGAATAEIFAQHGYDLILVARNNDKLQSVKKDLLTKSADIKIELLPIDLQNFNKDQFIECTKKVATPTALINNAGIYQSASFESTSDQEWTEQFQVNLLGSVKITRACWKIFTENKSGSIVNVASTLGISPVSHTSAYSAVKAAMINWTMTLALEGGPWNIRANCISPGIIDTPIHSFHKLNDQEKKQILESISQSQILKKIGQPSDIAKAIYFLASENSAFTTGINMAVDGGINLK